MSLGWILTTLVIAALAALGGWLWAGRQRTRSNGVGGIRRLLQTLVERRVLLGRPAFARLFPGAYVHFVPRDTPVERGVSAGEALAGREAGGGALVRFTLADLYGADHPASDAFGPAVGLTADRMDPQRIVFTVVPEVLRRRATEAVAGEGMEVVEHPEAFLPRTEDPFGNIEIRRGPHREEIAVADLVAEAVTTVTPIEIVAADRAHRLQGDLQLYEAFHDTAAAVFAPGRVRYTDGRLEVELEDGSARRLDYRRLASRIPGGRAAWRAYLEQMLPEAVRDPGLGAHRRPKAEVIPLRRSEGPVRLPAPSAEGWVARKLKPLSLRSLPEAGELVMRDRGGYLEVFTFDDEEGSVYLAAAHPAAQVPVEVLAEQADATLDRLHFSGHAIVTRLAQEGVESLTLVGPQAASIAQHPDLLAGAAMAAGVFRPGERVRVRVEREGVLVIAEAAAREPFLATCRRAAARFADAVELGLGEALHLDLLDGLGEHPVGRFALLPVARRFFTAEVQERTARAAGDLPHAAEARAMMRLSLGDPEGGRAHLGEAVRLAPEDAELQLSFGTLLNDLGDHAAAEQVLRSAVALAPGSAAVNNNLGVAYQGLERPEEAVLFFQKASELEPGDPLIRVNLGRAQLELGHVGLAEAAFREALLRDTRCVPALTGLVMSAVRQGEGELARRRLGNALAVDPTDETLLRLHRALYPDEPLH